MKSSILNTTIVNQVVRNLRKAGYDVESDETTHKVDLDGETIFWAMQHSSGKNYLVRYDERLLTPAN